MWQKMPECRPRVPHTHAPFHEQSQESERSVADAFPDLNSEKCY